MQPSEISEILFLGLQSSFRLAKEGTLAWCACVIGISNGMASKARAVIVLL